jgi:hypothetical protein
VTQIEVGTKVSLMGFSKLVVILNAPLGEKYFLQIEPSINVVFKSNHICDLKAIGLFLKDHKIAFFPNCIRPAILIFWNGDIREIGHIRSCYLHKIGAYAMGFVERGGVPVISKIRGENNRIVPDDYLSRISIQVWGLMVDRFSRSIWALIDAHTGIYLYPRSLGQGELIGNYLVRDFLRLGAPQRCLSLSPASFSLNSQPVNGIPHPLVDVPRAIREVPRSLNILSSSACAYFSSGNQLISLFSTRLGISPTQKSKSYNSANKNKLYDTVGCYIAEVSPLGSVSTIVVIVFSQAFVFFLCGWVFLAVEQ